MQFSDMSYNPFLYLAFFLISNVLLLQVDQKQNPYKHLFFIFYVELFIYANYLVLLYLPLWRSIIYIWVHYPYVFTIDIQCLREETRELNKKRRRYFLDMNGVKYAQASNYCCLRTRLYAHIFLTIDNSCPTKMKVYYFHLFMHIHYIIKMCCNLR